MRSNASLLSFLTISHNDLEHIFFAYLKEVHDLAPEKLYWYKDRGKDGAAKYLWRERGIKQWLLAGNDKEIKDIWEELHANRNYTFNWSKGIQKQFTILPSELQVLEGKYRFIDGLPPLMFSDLPYAYKLVNHDQEIDFLFDEQSNCNFLEGYAYHELIDPVYPPGLLSKDTLFNYIKEKANAVYVKRDIYYTMREYGGAQSKESKFLMGFIQEDKDFRIAHGVEIRTDDGTHIVGSSDIDPVDGKWTVPLDHDEGRGQLRLINKNSGQPTNGEKYGILKSINISNSIGHTVMTDLFDRKITLFSEEEKRDFQPVESISWDATLAPDGRQSEIELSDKILSVLLSLGSHIVISDPYLLGPIGEASGTGQIVVLSKSQLIFLNALVIAIGKGQILSLKLLGDWSKAKRFMSDDKEEAKRKYTLLWKFFKDTYKTSPGLQLATLELAFSNERFHDRYWMSELPGNDAVYLVSNSTNGPFESDELKITKQNPLDAIKEKAKFRRRYGGAEKINLIT